jgi:hypothetical protein
MNEEELFDDTWINNFESEDDKYKIFYIDEMSNIKVNCLYINKNKELEKITEKYINLKTNNKLEKGELIKLIKDNEKIDKDRYKLISILIYNFNLENTELKNFLKDNKDYDLLKKLNNIDDYMFDESIKYFQKLNNIFIIFNAEEKSKLPLTKRIKFKINNGRTRRKRVI